MITCFSSYEDQDSEKFDIHKEPERYVKVLAGYAIMSDAESVSRRLEPTLSKFMVSCGWCCVAGDGRFLTYLLVGLFHQKRRQWKRAQWRNGDQINHHENHDSSRIQYKQLFKNQIAPKVILHIQKLQPPQTVAN